jgi:hypothetical protein
VHSPDPEASWAPHTRPLSVSLQVCGGCHWQALQPRRMATKQSVNFKTLTSKQCSPHHMPHSDSSHATLKQTLHMNTSACLAQNLVK